MHGELETWWADRVSPAIVVPNEMSCLSGKYQGRPEFETVGKKACHVFVFGHPSSGPFDELFTQMDGVQLSHE